jgi:hypothetical protein
LRHGSVAATGSQPLAPKIPTSHPHVTFRGDAMQSDQRKTFAAIAGLATLVATLAIAALAAGPGYAKQPDLNGPARAVEGSTIDLRSPDRQAPAPEPAAQPPARPHDPAGDRISPDAADPASPGRTPVGTSVRNIHRPSVVDPSDDGLDWWSAVAGAGAMITITLAGLTGYLAVTRRRGATGAQPTTVAAGH